VEEDCDFNEPASNRTRIDTSAYRPDSKQGAWSNRDFAQDRLYPNERPDRKDTCMHVSKEQLACTSTMNCYKDGSYPGRLYSASRELENYCPLPEPLSDLRQLHVDTESAESIIEQKAIGRRIRYLRQKQSISLNDLGARTGLSSSFLSQLETGRVVPTLRNLARIAIVFSTDLSFFFEPVPTPLFKLHRSYERRLMPQTGVADPTYMFKSIGYLVPGRTMDPYFVEFLPSNPNVDGSKHEHPGYEFMLVLSGVVQVAHNSQRYDVAEGDSIYFDSSVSHSYRCKSPSSATAIIVTFSGSLDLVKPQQMARRRRKPFRPQVAAGISD
jgi:transcriptional regulator with XRE-family HTH domain